MNGIIGIHTTMVRKLVLDFSPGWVAFDLIDHFLLSVNTY